MATTARASGQACASRLYFEHMFEGSQQEEPIHGGEHATLDEQSEILVGAIMQSEKGSPARNAAIDAYFTFVRDNFDYVANDREWKPGEEQARAAELRRLFEEYDGHTN